MGRRRGRWDTSEGAGVVPVDVLSSAWSRTIRQWESLRETAHHSRDLLLRAYLLPGSSASSIPGRSEQEQQKGRRWPALRLLSRPQWANPAEGQRPASGSSDAEPIRPPFRRRNAAFSPSFCIEPLQTEREWPQNETPERRSDPAALTGHLGSYVFSKERPGRSPTKK